MMSDIVEHARVLRSELTGKLPNGVGNTIDLMADEITRLRAENERLRLDNIEVFRIIRAAGRSDAAKADAIAKALQETGHD